MTGPRPLLRYATGGLLGIMALVSGSACSSNDPAPSVSASEAAETIAAVFDVPADQQVCLEAEFSGATAARRVLSGQDVASADDLRALGQVEAACIPAETLALAITNGASQSFDDTLTDAQKTCLTDGVIGLDEDDRAKLLVGLVVSNSGALDMAGIAELGQITNGLLDTCDLDIASTQTLPPG